MQTAPPQSPAPESTVPPATSPPPGLEPRNPVETPNPNAAAPNPTPSPTPEQANRDEAPDEVEPPSKVPYAGPIQPYEKNWVFQLVMILVLLAIAVGNLYLNFQMIEIYEDLISSLEGLATVDEMNQTVVDEVRDECESQLEESDGACDTCFFVDGFDKSERIDLLKTILRIIKASTYISVGISVWIFFLIKLLSAYHLVYMDFAFVRMKQRREELVSHTSSFEYKLPKTAATSHSGPCVMSEWAKHCTLTTAGSYRREITSRVT